MATNNDEGGSGNGQAWDGYSDYRTVSSRIGNLIFDAHEAYARVRGLHKENAQIMPDQTADARAHILAAAMVLRAEMSHERGRDGIDDILARWEDGEGEAEEIDVSVPDRGFMGEFRDIVLYDDDPPWLGQFVMDMWRAGWELGYLKAGRHEESGPRELEPIDVNELLEP